jgi:hypothetical protein
LIDVGALSSGTRYVLDYNVIEQSGGDFSAVDMGGVTLSNVVGKHTMEFDATSTVFQIKRAGGAAMMKLRVNSVKPVLRTDSSQPSISITQIGDDISVTDGTTSFKIQSLQTATGLFSGLSQAQFLATPETPANQTTGSLGTDTYILTMLGTGSVSATDNTATSDAAGQSATEGSPLVIVVSGAGTIDMVVTGTVDTFNLQDSPVETPFILTSPRSETVTSTPIAETKATSQTLYGVWVSNPDRAGQTTSTLTSSEVDSADGFILRLQSATELQFFKRIGGSTIGLLQPTYTHQADTPMICVFKYDSDGMMLSVADVGGVLSPTSNSNTTPITLGSTLETGSRGGANQFQGEPIFNGFFTSLTQALDFVEANKWADVSALR